MKSNMGLADRIIRILIAVIIGILYFTNLISGQLAGVALIFAAIFIATSFISFCPLYRPFNFSTKSSKSVT